MALDPVVLNPGVGGDSIGTDNVGGVNYEVVKQAFGPVGTVTLVEAAAPLPVTDAIAEAALASIAAEDFATAANQGTEIAALASILAKLSSDPATQTTLAAVLAKLIANPATDTLQTTGNATLASILAKIIAAPATEAKQDTQITALGTLATQTTLAAVLAKIISAPSTEAKQDAIITLLTTIDAGTAAALGQALMAASVPVTIASDQSAIPVTFSGLATDNTTLYSNNLSATGAITGILTTGYSSIIFSFSGVWAGNLLVEGSEDNSIWEQKIVLDVNEFAMQDVINENGIFQIKSSSKYVRLNVQQVTGTITALIVGRTVPGLNAADSIAFAMDKSFNMPLYVSEVDSKKDIRNALIPSDAPAPIYGWAQATSAVLFQVDTTGYQSIVVETLTLGSNITIQHSNNGTVWYSLLGYNSTVATASASISAIGMYEFPVVGRFIRGLMAGANFVNVLVYLRQRPVNPFNNSLGGIVNLLAINGTTPVTGGVAGILAVGGNIANGVAPTANPILIAGIDNTATAGLTRRILVDTSGRTIIAGTDQTATTRAIGVVPAAASTLNVASLTVQDTSQFEGQSQIELLAQILLELRINNQMMAELPLVLQGQNGKFDEPSQFRQDQSLFAI